MKCEFAGFDFPDILLLIGLKARTGELVIEAGNNIGSIIFHDGNILQAFSPYSRAIGDLLVEGGIISEEELLGTLRLQKKNDHVPIGSLFVKTGKVSLAIIESLVHVQIRQSVKEFMSWNTLRLSFLEKDIRPFDRIHLPVHEFLPPDALESSQTFLAMRPAARGPVPPPSTSAIVR
jgi:hypothetical protein